MFQCKGCVDKEDAWRFNMNMSISYGTCEVCGKTGECVDAQSYKHNCKEPMRDNTHSLEDEMQELQRRIDNKELMLVDDDHYSNSELHFEIEEHTRNLRMTFAPQLGGDNVMSLGSDRVEQLIEFLQYYLDRMTKEIDDCPIPITERTNIKTTDVFRLYRTYCKDCKYNNENACTKDKGR